MKKTYLLTNFLSLVGRRFRYVSSAAVIAGSLISWSCADNEIVSKAPADAPVHASAAGGSIGINVLVNQDVNTIISSISAYGTVTDVLPQINALTMRIPKESLSMIQGLSYVVAANPDQARNGAPIDLVSATNFTDGLSTWNLDAINVTNIGVGRTVAQDGSNVFIGILDSGLLDSWRQYFPEERIATELARAFAGGGGTNGTVSSQPNKWEHDQNSHGTHVTSTILGYQLGAAHINGVAPMATVIPVKVLNQNGSGWSSVIARGILYMAELKMTTLSGKAVVVNMSLGGSALDAMEKAAIDYAVAKGVIIVASAGNSGTKGMGYPGAYAPVISVGSAGWRNAWATPSWWYATDFPDPTNVNDLYISDFSSRAKAGQDLDVIAPGSAIVGPYQVNSGQTSYYYLDGTSMASPHVAGIVALMTQTNPNLTAPDVEALLESAALPMAAGSGLVRQSNGTTTTISWGADAVGHGFITATAALSAL